MLTTKATIMDSYRTIIKWIDSCFTTQQLLVCSVAIETFNKTYSGNASVQILSDDLDKLHNDRHTQISAFELLRIKQQDLVSLVQKETMPTTENRVIRTVITCTGVSLEEMCGKSRFRRVVDSRFLAIYFMRETYRYLPYREIGNIFNVDHSSVTYAIQKTEDYLQTDLNFRQLFEKIKRELNLN